MPDIKIEKSADINQLNAMNVFDWPVWIKEVSEFPWYYDTEETCYFLEGRVILTPDEGEPVEFGKGDLVTLPQGMHCTWKILQDVRKHYQFK